MFEQRRIGRLVWIIQVRYRLLHSEPEEFLPDPVRNRARKPWILRVCEPDGELIPHLFGILCNTAWKIRPGRSLVLSPRDPMWVHRFARGRVFVSVVRWESHAVRWQGVYLRHVRAQNQAGHFFIENALGNFNRGFVVVDLSGGAKKCGHFVKVALRPLRHRMVVALGACHVRAEKSGECVG